MLWWITGGIVALLLLVAGGALAWYYAAISPLASGDVDNVQVRIAEGSAPSQIGQLLEDEKVIRSQYAFDVYTRLHGVRNNLQAGVFSLSPTESTAEIVAHLTGGNTEQYAVTFYPGATLNGLSNSTDKTPSHRQVLERLGFGAEEIDAAFSASYDSSCDLFAGKPAIADLEGYIYGETYMMASGSTARQVLQRTFDEYCVQLEKNQLISGFKKQDLTLYEAITLASIIQREVSNVSDQKQVAQVFYKRLAEAMPLGADATFIFAASKLGVAPSVDVDSPYNTRKYGGLPPGPISSPGLTALQAVAAPASGDYLYFVSGDDGKNYFSRTLEEHEAKTAQYCHENCRLF